MITMIVDDDDDSKVIFIYNIICKYNIIYIIYMCVCDIKMI